MRLRICNPKRYELGICNPQNYFGLQTLTLILQRITYPLRHKTNLKRCFGFAIRSDMCLGNLFKQIDDTSSSQSREVRTKFVPRGKRLACVVKTYPLHRKTHILLSNMLHYLKLLCIANGIKIIDRLIDAHRKISKMIDFFWKQCEECLTVSQTLVLTSG